MTIKGNRRTEEILTFCKIDLQLLNRIREKTANQEKTVENLNHEIEEVVLRKVDDLQEN